MRVFGIPRKVATGTRGYVAFRSGSGEMAADGVGKRKNEAFLGQNRALVGWIPFTAIGPGRLSALMGNGEQSVGR